MGIEISLICHVSSTGISDKALPSMSEEPTRIRRFSREILLNEVFYRILFYLVRHSLKLWESMDEVECRNVCRRPFPSPQSFV